VLEPYSEDGGENWCIAWYLVQVSFFVFLCFISFLFKVCTNVEHKRQYSVVQGIFIN